MEPSDFPKTNTAVIPPKELAAIREYVEGKTYISLWRATFWERVRFLFHGRLWLFVVGQNHPPMAMMIAKDPFVEEGES
jgi:hypothetical protein